MSLGSPADEKGSDRSNKTKYGQNLGHSRKDKNKLKSDSSVTLINESSKGSVYDEGGRGNTSRRRIAKRPSSFSDTRKTKVQRTTNNRHHHKKGEKYSNVEIKKSGKRIPQSPSKKFGPHFCYLNTCPFIKQKPAGTDICRPTTCDRTSYKSDIKITDKVIRPTTKSAKNDQAKRLRSKLDEKEYKDKSEPEKRPVSKKREIETSREGRLHPVSSEKSLEDVSPIKLLYASPETGLDVIDEKEPQKIAKETPELKNSIKDHDPTRTKLLYVAPGALVPVEDKGTKETARPTDRSAKEPREKDYPNFEHDSESWMSLSPPKEEKCSCRSNKTKYIQNLGPSKKDKNNIKADSSVALISDSSKDLLSNEGVRKKPPTRCNVKHPSSFSDTRKKKDPRTTNIGHYHKKGGKDSNVEINPEKSGKRFCHSNKCPFTKRKPSPIVTCRPMTCDRTSYQSDIKITDKIITPTTKRAKDDEAKRLRSKLDEKKYKDKSGEPEINQKDGIKDHDPTRTKLLYVAPGALVKVEDTGTRKTARPMERRHAKEPYEKGSRKQAPAIEKRPVGEIAPVERTKRKPDHQEPKADYVQSSVSSIPSDDEAEDQKTILKKYNAKKLATTPSNVHFSTTRLVKSLDSGTEWESSIENLKNAEKKRKTRERPTSKSRKKRSTEKKSSSGLFGSQKTKSKELKKKKKRSPKKNAIDDMSAEEIRSKLTDPTVLSRESTDNLHRANKKKPEIKSHGSEKRKHKIPTKSKDSEEALSTPSDLSLASDISLQSDPSVNQISKEIERKNKSRSGKKPTTNQERPTTKGRFACDGLMPPGRKLKNTTKSKQAPIADTDISLLSKTLQSPEKLYAKERYTSPASERKPKDEAKKIPLESKRRPQSLEPSDTYSPSKNKPTRKVSKKHINLEDYEPVSHPTYCDVKPNCLGQKKKHIYTGLLRKRKPPQISETSLTTDESATSSLGREPSEERDLSVIDYEPVSKETETTQGALVPVVKDEIDGYLVAFPDGTYKIIPIHRDVCGCGRHLPVGVYEILDIKPKDLATPDRIYEKKLGYIKSRPDGTVEIHPQISESDLTGDTSRRKYDPQMGYLLPIPPGTYPIKRKDLVYNPNDKRYDNKLGHIQILPDGRIEYIQSMKKPYKKIGYLKVLPDNTFEIFPKIPDTASLDSQSSVGPYRDKKWLISPGIFAVGEKSSRDPGKVAYLKSFGDGTFEVHPIITDRDLLADKKCPLGFVKQLPAGVYPILRRDSDTGLEDLSAPNEKYDNKFGFIKRLPDGNFIYPNPQDTNKIGFMITKPDLTFEVYPQGLYVESQPGYPKRLPAGIFEVRSDSCDVDDCTKRGKKFGYLRSLSDGTMEFHPKIKDEDLLDDKGQRIFDNKTALIKTFPVGTFQLTRRDSDLGLDDASIQNNRYENKIGYVKVWPDGVFEICLKDETVSSLRREETAEYITTLPVGSYEIRSKQAKTFGNQAGYLLSLPDGTIEVRSTKSGKLYDNKIKYVKILPNKYFEIKLEALDGYSSSVTSYESQKLNCLPSGIYEIRPLPKESKPKIGAELPIGIIHEIQNKQGATVGYLEIMPNGSIEIRPRRTGKIYDNGISYINSLPDGDYEIKLEAPEGDSLSNKTYDSSVDYLKSLPAGIYRLKTSIEILPLGTYVMKTQKGALVGYVESLPNGSMEIRPRRTGKMYDNKVEYIKSLPDDTFAINLKAPEGETSSIRTYDSTVDYLKSLPAGIYILKLIPKEKDSLERLEKIPVGTYEIRCKNSENKVGYLESLIDGPVELRPRRDGKKYDNIISYIKIKADETYEVKLLTPDGDSLSNRTYDSTTDYMKSLPAGIYDLIQLPKEILIEQLPIGAYEMKTKHGSQVGYVESLPNGMVELRPRRAGKLYDNKIRYIKSIISDGTYEILIQAPDGDSSSIRTYDSTIDYIKSFPTGIYILQPIPETREPLEEIEQIHGGIREEILMERLPVGSYEMMNKHGSHVGYVESLPNGKVELRPRRAGKLYENKIRYIKSIIPDGTFEILLQAPDGDSSSIRTYDSTIDYIKSFPTGIYILQPRPEIRKPLEEIEPIHIGIREEILLERLPVGSYKMMKKHGSQVGYVESLPNGNVEIRPRRAGKLYDNKIKNIKSIISDGTFEILLQATDGDSSSIRTYDSTIDYIKSFPTGIYILQPIPEIRESLGEIEPIHVGIREEILLERLPAGSYEMMNKHGSHVGYVESLPNGMVELRPRRAGKLYDNKIRYIKSIISEGTFEILLQAPDGDSSSIRTYDSTIDYIKSFPTGIYILQPIPEIRESLEEIEPIHDGIREEILLERLPVGSYEMMNKHGLHVGYVESLPNGMVELRPRRAGKLYDNKIRYIKSIISDGTFEILLQAPDGDSSSIRTYDSTIDYIKSFPTGIYILQPIPEIRKPLKEIEPIHVGIREEILLERLPVGSYKMMKKHGSQVGYVESLPNGNVEIRPRRAGKLYDNKIKNIKRIISDGTFEILLQAPDGDSSSIRTYDSTIDYIKSFPTGIYILQPIPDIRKPLEEIEPIHVGIREEILLERLPVGSYEMMNKHGSQVGYVESLPNGKVEIRPRRAGKLYDNTIRSIKNTYDGNFEVLLEAPEVDSVSNRTYDSTVDYIKSFPTGIYILHPITNQGNVETMERVPAGSYEIRCGSQYEIKIGYLESLPDGTVELRPRREGKTYDNKINYIKRQPDGLYQIKLDHPEGKLSCKTYDSQIDYMKGFPPGIFGLVPICEVLNSKSIDVSLVRTYEVISRLPIGTYVLRQANTKVGYLESLPGGLIELRPKIFGELYDNTVESISKHLPTETYEIKLLIPDGGDLSKSSCHSQIKYKKTFPSGIYELYPISDEIRCSLPEGLYEIRKEELGVGYAETLPDGSVELRPKRYGKKYNNRIEHIKTLTTGDIEIKLEEAYADLLCQTTCDISIDYVNLPVGIYALHPMGAQLPIGIYELLSNENKVEGYVDCLPNGLVEIRPRRTGKIYDNKIGYTKWLPDGLYEIKLEIADRETSSIQTYDSVTDYLKSIPIGIYRLRPLPQVHVVSQEVSTTFSKVSNLQDVEDEVNKCGISKTNAIESDQVEITISSEITKNNSEGTRINESITSERECMRDENVHVSRSSASEETRRSTLKSFSEFVQYFSLPVGLYELRQRESRLGYVESFPDGSIQLRSERYGNKYNNKICELRSLQTGSYQIKLLEDKSGNKLKRLPSGIYELHPLGDVLPVGTYELFFKRVQTGYVKCSSDGLVEIRPRRDGKKYDNRIGYTKALSNQMYEVEIEPPDGDELSVGTYDSVTDYMKSLPRGIYQLRSISSEKDLASADFEKTVSAKVTTSDKDTKTQISETSFRGKISKIKFFEESRENINSNESADNRYQTRTPVPSKEACTSNCADAKNLKPTVLDLDVTVLLETNAEKRTRVNANGKHGEPSVITTRTFVIKDDKATYCKKVVSLTKGRYTDDSYTGKQETLSEFIDDVITNATWIVNKYKQEMLNTGSTLYNKCPDHVVARNNVHHECCECADHKKVTGKYDFYERQYEEFTVESQEEPMDETYSLPRTKSMKGRFEEAQKYPCVTTTEYTSFFRLPKDIDGEFNSSKLAKCYCKERSCKCTFSCLGRHKVHKDATSDNTDFNGDNESLIKITDARSKNEFESEIFIRDKGSFEKSNADMF